MNTREQNEASAITIAILMALLGGVLFLASCQSAPKTSTNANATRLTASLGAVDSVLDSVDGTALALDNGTQTPKEAATDLHGQVKAGKDAVVDVKGSTAKLQKDYEQAVIDRDKAASDLASRARNRIEWALIIGGFACWGFAGFLFYSLFAGGGLSEAEAVADPKSVIRRGGTALSFVAIGGGLFAVAIYFDLIVSICLWTIGIVAVVALVAAALHYRKHHAKAVAKLASK
jgi:hypothetical protein